MNKEINVIKVDDSLYNLADTNARQRLDSVEYQNVITDIGFEHDRLPEGEKVVSIYSDGNFGNNAYVCTSEDLIPRKTFNKTFPHNGITITKKDKTYHIEGTNTLNDSLSIHFGQTPNDINIELDETLIGKTLKLITFASETAENLGLVVELRNSDNTRLERKSMYVAKTNTYNSSTVVVPEGTVYMRVAFSVPAGITLNHDIQVYIVVDEDTQAIDLNSSLTAEVDTTVTELFTFPYQSTVSTKLSLVDYIGYTADNSEAVTSLSYLTPEDFGAVGDGYDDDSVPISLCLATAETTKQTVLMAKKYYISNPIDINTDGLQIIINDIEYDGADVAIKIRGRHNTIKIHSIDSKGSGINFVGDGTRHITHNDLEINTITSKSHGIGFYSSPVSIYQNVIRFNYIKAGGDGCYGIAYFLGEDTFITENNFYGGHIENCDWAVYKVAGNSRLINIQVEGDVKGGFYIIGNVNIIKPRWAESSRDGEYPFLKFASTINPANIEVDSSVPLSIYDIDLSENIDTFTNDAGGTFPLTETRISTLNFPIIPTRIGGTGTNVQSGSIYCTKAYVWGKFLIMTPHMAYRKEVKTEMLDTRLIGQETTELEIQSLSQLPTKFVVNTVNTEIHLHASYCAFGFNEFEVEQLDGFTCKVYDVLDNLIFDGTNKGDGLYRFNVYKDSDKVVNYGNGQLRRDFIGHYWNIEKINIPTKISQLENDSGFIAADDIPEVEIDLSEVITVEEAILSHTPNYMPDKSEFVGGWINETGKFTSSSNNMISPFIAIDESLIGKKLTIQRYVGGSWERIGQIKSITAFNAIVEPDASGMFNSNNVIEALNDVTRNSSDGTYAVYAIPDGTKYIRVAVGNAVVTQSVNQPMFVINDDESILGEYVANESVSIEGKKELVDDIMVNGSNLSENAMQKISKEINVDSAKPLRVSALSRMFTCADETEDFISVVDTYLKTGNKTAWLYGLYDELVTAYPEYVTRTQIATTATPTLPIYKSDGTERTDITSDTVFPMYRYDFTPPISAKTNGTVNSLEKEIALPKILYTGGIHGGEYLQVISAYRFFKMLCEKWQDHELLEDLRWNVHFVVVPLTNPFGFNFPSNRNTAERIGVSKLNERNVDISGNFPSDDYVSGENGKYGTTALSEPESVAIYNIIQNEEFILGIDNHTYGYLGTEYDGEHMGAYFIANHTKHSQSTEFWFKIGRWLNSRVRKLSPDIANTSFKNSDLSQLWSDPKDQMLNNTFRSVGANIEMPISIDPVKTTHEDASTGLLPMAEETQAYMVDLLATVFYEALNDFYTY